MEETTLVELNASMKLLIASMKKRIESFSIENGLLILSSKATSSPQAFVDDLGLYIKTIEQALTELYQPEKSNNPNEYWSLLNHSELFNKFMQTRATKLFRDIAKINENLRIEIPSQFHRAHHYELSGCISSTAEDLPDRENYSQPIVHNHKYAYFKAYDGKDHVVANLTEEEKRDIISSEISKNSKDAQNIFLYTQAKRARRALFHNQEDNYFSRNETESDIYDVEQRQLGPPCCYASDTPVVTTIGHATLLIQFPTEGVTVLTDPVFHDMQTVLYPRKTEPAWMESQLPLIDVILISHNHRDHVDEPSLLSLVPHQPLVLVPLGDAALMKSLGFNHIVEHNTWQRTCLTTVPRNEDDPGAAISFISVPANHWSCRGLNDANKSLFLGWVIAPSSRKGSIYFAGDTAELSTSDHKDILMNPNFAPVEVNLVPGGPNYKRGTMQNTHASAADGIYSHFYHLYLRARETHPFDFEAMGDDYDENVSNLVAKKFCKTVFMHHNTFELGVDRYNEAEYVRDDLIRALKGDTVQGFVKDTANKIVQLCDWKVSHEEIIQDVLNPKIGNRIFL